MKKQLYTFFIFLSFTAFIHAQTDYIPADNNVYSFLKKLSVRGLINYDESVLPLPRYAVNSYLNDLSSYPELLNENEKRLLEKYKLRFDPGKSVSIINEGFGSVFSRKEKNLYRYNDSLVSFTVNPLLDIKYIYSSYSERSAQLINFGGRAYGSYSDWFGFSAQATNGVVNGNKYSALKDPRVAQNFTFNNTDINYFDAAEGHLALHTGILNFQLGRERILWGRGNIDRLVLSAYPPEFDFLRFSIKYKALSYEFLHGWLVQPVAVTYIDSMAGDVKSKSPKYIASNRLGINILDNLNAGITQTIIYANRPVEAAYLNPFLLWESAQRSLNDLDNSFLTFDLKWRLIEDIEWNASFLFDDIHFGRLFDQGWNIVDNRSAFQTGLNIVPGVISDLLISLEYSFVRPYTFSHAGIGESLTYTNNGYFLGIPVQPNSVKYALQLNYQLTPDLDFGLNIQEVDHGANEYSREGKLNHNYGGNIFENLRLIDSRDVRLLDGVREKDFIFSLSMGWEFVRNYMFNFTYLYNRSESGGKIIKQSVISAALALAFQ